MTGVDSHTNFQPSFDLRHHLVGSKYFILVSKQFRITQSVKKETTKLFCRLFFQKNEFRNSALHIIYFLVTTSYRLLTEHNTNYISTDSEFTFH